MTGIVLIYPSTTTLENIRASINQKWKSFERTMKQPNVYAWRNEDLGFVIGVGNDENDEPSITMRMIKKKAEKTQ